MGTAEILAAVDAKFSDGGFNALTEPERTVWLVSWVDFEVNLGGAQGYLYNSAGDYLPDLPAAFLQLGCPNIARSAQHLVDELERLCQVRDRVDRHRIVCGAPESVGRAMDEFTSAVQECVDDYGDK